MGRHLGLAAFELGELLGAGASGQVFAAVHRSTGELVAVKRVPAEEALAEAAVIARLDHPNVVRLYDVGSDADGGYLVMERATGTVQAPSDFAGLALVLEQVLAGLAAAHAAEVLHLDLKPANVLVRADGTLAVADFGLACEHGSAGGQRGTPAYMAPECFDGRPLDGRTDLYAVGVMAYALASGELPFPERDWARAAVAHRDEPVPPLRPQIGVPAGFEAFVCGLLAKDPSARFGHAWDARVALRGLGIPVVAPVGRGALQVSPTTRAESPGPGLVPMGSLRRTAPSTSRAAELPLGWPAEGGVARAPGPRRLGTLPVPLVGQSAARESLWAQLLEVQKTGRGRRVSLTGCRGGHRALLARAFVQAAREVGCGAPGEGRVGVAFGDGPTDEATLWVGEDLPAPDSVVRVPLPSVAACREALTAWIALPSRWVTDLSLRCGGDVQLAVDSVREAMASGVVRSGARGLVCDGPVPLSPAAVAGQMRWLTQVPSEWSEALGMAGIVSDRAVLRRLCPVTVELETWLLAGGLAEVQQDELRWASGVLQAAAAGSEAAPERHRRAAQVTVGWTRGVHLLRGGDVLAAAALLLDEVPHVAASGRMVEVEGVLRELEDALRETQVPATDPLWAKLFGAFVIIGPTHLGHAACISYGERSVALALAAGDDPEWAATLASASNSLAWLYNMRGMPLEALPHVERSLALNPASPKALRNQGLMLLGAGRAVEALKAFEHAYMVTAPDDVYARQTAKSFAAIAHRYMGDCDTAIAAHLEAKAAFTQLGFHSADADVHTNLGEAHRQAGRLEEALRHYDLAVDIAAQGLARADMGCLVGAALCRLQLGQVEQPLATLEGCAAQLEDEGPTWEGMVGLHLLGARAAAGRQVSLKSLEEVLRLLASTGYVDPDLAGSARRIAAHVPELDEAALAAARGWEARLRGR